MIVLGYPGIGKSTVARNKIYNTYKIIDLESSNFDKNNLQQYCVIAEELSSQNCIVMISCHSDVQEYFKNHTDQKRIIVYPDKSLKDEWLHKLELRVNNTPESSEKLKNKRAFIRAEDHFYEDILEIESQDSIQLVPITRMDYSLVELIINSQTSKGGII